MQIVQKGTWLYDGLIARPVDIIALPYDFWFELAIADSNVEPGSVPASPDASGLLYYVRFAHAGQSGETVWPDSDAYESVGDAVSAAQERVSSPIEWEMS